MGGTATLVPPYKLSNVGSFLPGSVATVIQQDAPQKVYRNPLLAETMVSLNMIDTQGGGIKRMFQKQRNRFFPLPDYDLSEPERVKVELQGRILDERYTRLLMTNTDFDLFTIILLDKVQKRRPITAEEHRSLKANRLVEGCYPNIVVAGKVAAVVGEKARHIRDRGFERKYYEDLILALLREHQPVTREDIDRLLLDKLPEVLDDAQKENRIHNLLGKLAKQGQIRNDGSRKCPRWVLIAS
jgi:ATP-dependent DNA helicase RecG